MKSNEKRTVCTVRSTGEDSYFAASNSAHGFRSYYPACFDAARIGRLYAVKGGPGTGKSRFLRDVAEKGKGCGWHSELIYCSSDPDSLDGVVLTKPGEEGIALLDATAPHVYEPNRPGYREEIINLGSFWNAELLRAKGAEIAERNRRKQEAYRMAYRYLAGYGEMTATRDELVEPFLRKKAIRAFAEKWMRQIPEETEFEEQIALARSIGMRGMITLDTYYANAKTAYYVEDCRGSAAVFLENLYEIAKRKNLSVRVSYDPILPEKIDGLFFKESGIAFLAFEGGEKKKRRKISMRRFVETGLMHSCRKEINFAERMRRAMLQGAVGCFSRVSEAHFSVEEIYIRAMDFGAKESFTGSFCSSLFKA
ncbi:MAG: hypothetical protein E7680_02290 [Ruminococcaceae bacterium]|nr:hypothetical protein [Oscillospiraceae bacterium]